MQIFDKDGKDHSFSGEGIIFPANDDEHFFHTKI
jgi:hypothetical protein